MMKSDLQKYLDPKWEDSNDSFNRRFHLWIQAEAPTRKEKTVEEVTTLGKKVAEGEEYFAVAHIFASFNDTFVVSKTIK